MAFTDVFKAVFIPALIAAVLYSIISFICLPLIRKHRQRYAQYVPLDSIGSRTSTLRDRAIDALTNAILFPFRHRHAGDPVIDGPGDGRRGSESADGEDYSFGEEEGERMIGFNLNRRERGVGRGGTWVVAGGDRRQREQQRNGAQRTEELDSQRRLSRDLEEGFKDDSDDDNAGANLTTGR